MFADDMAIFSETKKGLQIGINDLYRYCKKWGITVNIDKTKVVVFKKGGRLAATDTWSYNGQKLEVVSHFKYLGFPLQVPLTHVLVALRNQHGKDYLL